MRPVASVATCCLQMGVAIPYAGGGGAVEMLDAATASGRSLSLLGSAVRGVGPRVNSRWGDGQAPEAISASISR